MTTEPANVFNVALSLPEGDRARLAYKLLQSLKPPASLSEEDPKFKDELDRRVQAYDAGETSAADWDTVSERLRKSLESIIFDARDKETKIVAVAHTSQEPG